MKEDFRMMKSSNKLTKEEGKKLRQQNYDLKWWKCINWKKNI